jgi:hypothetical protein
MRSMRRRVKRGFTPRPDQRLRLWTPPSAGRLEPNTSSMGLRRPGLRLWWGSRGLRIIGIHTPEFEFERVRPNVESAIRELDVRYPIAQDNEFQTWDAWDNRAWPSFYLLDGDGQVRLVREGEGIRAGDRDARAIYTLLDSNDYGEHLLELECATPGLSLFSATFG